MNLEEGKVTSSRPRGLQDSCIHCAYQVMGYGSRLEPEGLGIIMSVTPSPFMEEETEA